jgi:NH3-dependent NAD+ synthetase
MKTLDIPRSIDAATTFDALAQWFYDKLQQGAPGFLVGLSGTDSLVVFLAAFKACEKAGKSNRVFGVHFAPSEDFLYDHPEAKTHLWFKDNVIPWLKEQAPGADIIVDTSIDWRCDGLRWGYLMDLSVVSNDKKRMMRLPEDQYWVVGTRNRTEEELYNYSNASMAVSLQPIIHLWKSEILKISEYLKVPQQAIDKSCETDCICGRMALPARHIAEVDELLQQRGKEHMKEYTMSNELRQQLVKYIDAQIIKGEFKKNLPYIPDEAVFAFESGYLDLKRFNHFGHLYIAFHYLKDYGLEAGLVRYGKYLKPILDAAGQSHRFNMDITRVYFVHLEKIMKQYPAYKNFNELVEAIPSVLDKIKA